MKTYGDLLTALIAHYEKCIEELPEGKIERYDFLCEKNVFRGICGASNWLFHIDIYDTAFVDEFTGGNINLCEIPSRNLIKAKEMLQIRIDRMKELFPKWENVEL